MFYFSPELFLVLDLGLHVNNCGIFMGFMGVF